MLLYLVSGLLLVSSAQSRPQEAAAPSSPLAQTGTASTPIPIINQSAETKEDGGFSYSYETGNGIKVEENGSIKPAAPGFQGRSAAGEESTNNTVVVLQGSFSYTAPDGQVITVRYIADENGFQPEGDHLPTPPPALEEALKKNLDSQLGQQQSQEPQPTSQQPQ
ncbi:endocuticle structural glycoprotein SgAbd-4-like [Anthonomus grandis grandis]|uniref:endocuticle structural glycoprotein SgAbd-4-like n=1 Tax=Anthonomus grandis grandis TaxID=2921223 RepID=UPI0021667431|nr:endocuticle structural glycoprotein SgAbd-4-like [Anthonomus grandis grandis]